MKVNCTELIRKSIGASVLIGLGDYALLKLGTPIGPFLFALGLLFSVADAELAAIASEKVASWEISWSFFLRSVFCGIIMYVTVAMYRRGTPLGILFGVPPFIFCGFQHCIANVITLGVAATFSWTLFLAVAHDVASCYAFSP